MRHVEEVLNATGLTYRQLDHWTRRGYLKHVFVNSKGEEFDPSTLDREGAVYNPASGTGFARRWTDDETRVAATMRRLTDAGMSPSAAHAAARIMVDGKAAVIGPGLIVADVAS